MSLEHLTPKKIGSSSTNGISTPDDLSVSSSNFTDRDGKINLMYTFCLIPVNSINEKITGQIFFKFNFTLSKIKKTKEIQAFFLIYKIFIKSS